MSVYKSRKKTFDIVRIVAYIRGGFICVRVKLAGRRCWRNNFSRLILLIWIICLEDSKITRNREFDRKHRLQTNNETLRD